MKATSTRLSRAGAPASDDYASPNPYGGTLQKVVIEAQPAGLAAVDLERIRQVQWAAWQASE